MYVIYALYSYSLLWGLTISKHHNILSGFILSIMDHLPLTWRALLRLNHNFRKVHLLNLWIHSWLSCHQEGSFKFIYYVSFFLQKVSRKIKLSFIFVALMHFLVSIGNLWLKRVPALLTFILLVMLGYNLYFYPINYFTIKV